MRLMTTLCALFLQYAILNPAKQDLVDAVALLRRQRVPKFLDDVMNIVSHLSHMWSGGLKQGSMDERVCKMGYCIFDMVECNFLQCLATNFNHSHWAHTVSDATKVVLDTKLREAIVNDPNILKIACEKGRLDNFGCNGFRQFLGLFEIIDPASSHANDEPRARRSATESSGTSAVTVSLDVNQQTAPQSRLAHGVDETIPTAETGGHFDYYENQEDSKPKSSELPVYQWKDCEALKRADKAFRNTRLKFPQRP